MNLKPCPIAIAILRAWTRAVLPEQLGLELESQRGPVDILVIESAERPTPD